MSDQEADVNDAKGTGPDGWKDAELLEVFEYPSIFASTAEKYRQEGRDEVYAEILKHNGSPFVSTEVKRAMYSGDGWCVFCGLVEKHEPDCVWVAAQEAVKRKAAR